MSLVKDVKKEVKQNRKKEKYGGNLWFDLVMQGLAFGALLLLAGHELIRHIQAAYPVNILLAAIGLGFLLYCIFTPFYRHK